MIFCKLKSISASLFILLFFLCKSYASNIANIEKISFDKKNNIEISIDKKTEFKAFILEKNDRLVLDISNANMSRDNIEIPEFSLNFRKVFKDNNLRLIFDLKQKIKIDSAEFKKLKQDKFGKIIIKISYKKPIEPNQAKLQDADKEMNIEDLIEKIDAENIEEIANYSKEDNGQALPNQSNQALPNSSNLKYVIKKPQNSAVKNNKIYVIAIDAGHGGKDPGTIGDYARTKEKNITLSYSRELAKHLSKNKNYKVFLTRDSDFFIPLKQRVEKARKINADLFISLHANSSPDNNVSGFSIYTLSEKSSDKQAELLAQKENRADIIAGINFKDTSGDVLNALIDISQRSSMNSSSEFANIVIRSMKNSEIEVLQNTHRFAGFAVLTAPDMSSVLIEIGYLSSKKEESYLNDLSYKRKMVKALVEAIDEYFKIN